VRILVVGAGAVGSLFGALLQRAGHDVTLVGRPAHMAAISQAGLRLEGSTEGTIRVRAVSELPADFAPELCLLTVKTYDLGSAAELFSRATPSPVPVAALQNGLGVEAQVERGLAAGGWTNPGDWIVRGINSVPANYAAPGVIRHAGQGELLLADYGAGRHAEAIAATFRSAGVPARRIAEREREVWRKVLVNAAINPVTADHGVSNGRLLLEPYRGQSLQLLREALAVARIEGFPFTDEEVEADLWRVVRATSDNRSSMLQDLDRGRRTEIDAISGTILERGRAHGLSLPATERIVTRIHSQEPRPPA
jgi:2-dehydropantoate 2-reductase